MANFTESDISKLKRYYTDETICIAKNTMYSLGESELDWCLCVATKKIFEKENYGMRNYNYRNNGMSFQEKESMSIAAELVFGRLVGLPDFDENEAINNEWCDFVINNTPIDVKSTNSNPPFLNINAAKANGRCADHIVLIQQINKFTYCFCGYINLVDITKFELVGGKSPFYRIAAADLGDLWL